MNDLLVYIYTIMKICLYRTLQKVCVFGFHLFLMLTSVSQDRVEKMGALPSVSLGVDKEQKGYSINNSV